MKIKRGGCAKADSEGMLNEATQQTTYHHNPREPNTPNDHCEEEPEAGGENRFLPQTEALPEPRPRRGDWRGKAAHQGT